MLQVKNLKVTFSVQDQTVTAVDNISFDVPKGKVIGLVGESGSGKSVTATSIMNLLSANGQIETGEIFWKGNDLLKATKKQIQQVRGKEIGLIFQNPLAALNPVFTIGNQMIETICLHQNVSKEGAKKIAVDLLKKVNIPDAEKRLNDYPHQFSIGMCQRIMIALTISMQPTLLIADEPTASLDVTIQAQILNLLNQLKDEFGMSLLIISHDLGVVAQHCDDIMVMYLGKIVEQGSVQDIFKNPLHPYTQALIQSIPIPDPNIKNTTVPLSGDIPSPMNIPNGCRFHTRCPKRFSDCDKISPTLKAVKAQHHVGCLLY